MVSRTIRVYIELAKEHGFKPVVLKEVLFLRNKGYSNTDIANAVGISRNTVGNYLEKLARMHEEQVAELLSLIALMHVRQKRFIKEVLELDWLRK